MSKNITTGSVDLDGEGELASSCAGNRVDSAQPVSRGTVQTNVEKLGNRDSGWQGKQVVGRMGITGERVTWNDDVKQWFSGVSVM